MKANTPSPDAELRKRLVENTKWLIDDSYSIGFDNGGGSREPLHEDSKLENHMNLIDRYVKAKLSEDRKAQEEQMISDGWYKPVGLHASADDREFVELGEALVHVVGEILHDRAVGDVFNRHANDTIRLSNGLANVARQYAERKLTHQPKEREENNHG